MRDTNLVNALREHAEWAQANEWETPITLGDNLTEAADRIEAQAKELDALRNELCLKCGNYTLAHDGPVMDVGGGGRIMKADHIVEALTGDSGWKDMIPQVNSSDFPTQWVPSAYECSIIDAQAKEIEKLRGQNRQLMLERNYVMSIIADVRKAGKTWMCQYCAHCKGIVSGMADCDSKKLCVMPYSQFELKRSEPPEVEKC